MNIFKRKPKKIYHNYVMDPKEDITAYELAIILQYQGYHGDKIEDVIEKLPSNVKRHLRIRD